jgi:hypothetical protein
MQTIQRVAPAYSISEMIEELYKGLTVVLTFMDDAPMNNVIGVLQEVTIHNVIDREDRTVIVDGVIHNGDASLACPEGTYTVVSIAINKQTGVGHSMARGTLDHKDVAPLRAGTRMTNRLLMAPVAV